MKLIAEWKTAYKLYSFQIGLLICILAIADIILRTNTSLQVPVWVFYITGPGVAIARVLQQFLRD